jgi:TRAP transporter TAXI family solute receptor
MKKVIGILVAVSLAASFSGLTMGVASGAQEKFEIQFLAGRSDSAEFALTHGISQLINKHSPWLRAKVVETPGMASNPELVVRKPEMKANAVVCGTVSDNAWLFKTPSEGGPSWGPYPDLRFVARFNETIHTLLALDPRIKTISDLKGKTLADGREVSYRWRENELILKEAGIRDTLRVTHGGTGAGMTALRDGLVDAAVALGTGPVEPTTWIPLAEIQEIMATKTVYFVSYDQTAFKKAKEKHGFGTSPVTYPAKVLSPTQTEPVVIKYDPLNLAADKMMRDDVIYELLRVFDTHLRELDQVSATAQWLKNEYLGTSGYEKEDMYHPGAIKYFKEKGIPIRVNPW